ncbi:hypothetical protein J7E68_15165 [Microbacterium sp. ISL-103]|uniref:hypothetical protein n=1 Tax=Microbacterium sp. ISL-103 TaxID=2819156 RepID=UPI001BE5948D|nr:hypothetical protein [Microbacterium sp. ISL-103]MBT2475877.1 hypothetical protein [Microbacterium sp. ISL-103]
MAFELLPDVVVPVGLGLISAFGATTYTNHLAAKREIRVMDDVAETAVRAYANALGTYSIYLEEVAIAGGFWDPAKTLMETGSADKIRAAWLAAQPYFHRLQVHESERAATSQSSPDGGDDAMEGSGNFHERAELVRKVLDRGLRPRR